MGRKKVLGANEVRPIPVVFQFVDTFDQICFATVDKIAIRL